MVPTPVPATPSGTHVDTDAGNRSSAVPGDFDATLQQAGPARKAPAASHGAASGDAPAADTATGNEHASKARDPKSGDTKDERDKRPSAANPANAPGAAVPNAVPTAVPTPTPTPTTRQATAVSGKPLPTDPVPTAAASASATGSADRASAQPGHAIAAIPVRPAVAVASDAPVALKPPAASATATDGAEGMHATTTTTQPALPIAQVIDAFNRKNDAGDTSRAGNGNGLGTFIQLAPAPGGAATGGPAPVPLTLQATPGQPQFAQEITQHVAWLVGNQVQQARIQLNPRALGPIDIDITTHHDRVDVSFAVQHPQTIQALQQTLPQLHDLLAQQGLNLGQASVGQQGPGQQHQPPAAWPGSAWRDADVTVPMRASALGRTRVGGVDEFA